MIRLVAIDLDETLLLPDRTISPRAKRAIGAVRRQDCHVVLATGRMFCAAEPYARELDLPGPLIAYQGSLVKSVGDKSIWRHLSISATQLGRLLPWLEEKPVHINLYVDDQLWVERMNTSAERYA
ncbi:MAG: HAD family phosphatase [Firmicutes bacterium]|nr:HAD family phosphatase [Bacillota bacterium]